MPRRIRLIFPNAPHHVTQRGVQRKNVFFCSRDYRTYLNLLRTGAKKFNVEVASYCLMPNHVHLLMIPKEELSLSRALAYVHQSYASYINKKMAWQGHLWQQRFYSSPLDEDHFWHALRYIAQNPVRGKIVQLATDYPWSSARAHCNLESNPILSPNHSLKDEMARKDDWITWLNDPSNLHDTFDHLRTQTQKDMPCGSNKFINAMREKLGREIIPRKKGRPSKSN